jgi:hypothetical protein
MSNMVSAWSLLYAAYEHRRKLPGVPAILIHNSKLDVDENMTD